MAWSDLFIYKTRFFLKTLFFIVSSNMSSEDIIEEQLQSLQQEASEVMEKVQVYQRKVMTPVWEKRREMIKKIPGFWGTAVSNLIEFF